MKKATFKNGSVHILVESEISVGRYKRAVDDPYCKPREKFPDVQWGPTDKDVTCKTCRQNHEKYAQRPIQEEDAPQPSQKLYRYTVAHLGDRTDVTAYSPEGAADYFRAKAGLSDLDRLSVTGGSLGNAVEWFPGDADDEKKARVEFVGFPVMLAPSKGSPEEFLSECWLSSRSRKHTAPPQLQLARVTWESGLEESFRWRDTKWVKIDIDRGKSIPCSVCGFDGKTFESKLGQLCQKCFPDCLAEAEVEGVLWDKSFANKLPEEAAALFRIGVELPEDYPVRLTLWRDGKFLGVGWLPFTPSETLLPPVKPNRPMPEFAPNTGVPSQSGAPAASDACPSDDGKPSGLAGPPSNTESGEDCVPPADESASPPTVQSKEAGATEPVTSIAGTEDESCREVVVSPASVSPLRIQARNIEYLRSRVLDAVDPSTGEVSDETWKALAQIEILEKDTALDFCHLYREAGEQQAHWKEYREACAANVRRWKKVESIARDHLTFWMSEVGDRELGIFKPHLRTQGISIDQVRADELPDHVRGELCEWNVVIPWDSVPEGPVRDWLLSVGRLEAAPDKKRIKEYVLENGSISGVTCRPEYRGVVMKAVR